VIVFSVYLRSPPGGALFHLLLSNGITPLGLGTVMKSNFKCIRNLYSSFFLLLYMYMGINGAWQFLIGDLFGCRELLQRDWKVKALFTTGLMGLFYYWASLFIHVINL
jgi:hypothetical protein